jgi:hypothetical protein
LRIVMQMRWKSERSIFDRLILSFQSKIWWDWFAVILSLFVLDEVWLLIKKYGLFF